MIAVMCGSRKALPFTQAQVHWLDLLWDRLPIGMVMTGSATGIDTYADAWAESRGIDRVLVPANWQGRGKSGGPFRNGMILQIASLLQKKNVRVIAFPGGAGTQNMVTQAQQWAVPVVAWAEYALAVQDGMEKELIASGMYGHTY